MLKYHTKMMQQNPTFLIRCKQCGNTMKYMAQGASSGKIVDISSKKKRCVYCGFTNSVRTQIVEKV